MARKSEYALDSCRRLNGGKIVMALVIISGLLFVMGALLVFKATRNVFSSCFLAIGIWLFIYTGGIILFLTKGHVLTPLIISIGVLSFGFGTIISTGYLRFKPAQELTRFRESTFCSFLKTNQIFFASLVLVFLISVTMIAYFFYQAGIPLLHPDGPALRTEAVAGRGLLFRAFLTFLPVITLMSYLYMRTVRTLGSKIFFVICGITGIASVILMASRAAGLIFLLPFLVLYGLVARKPRLRTLIVAFLLLVVTALGFQSLYMEGRGLALEDALLMLLARMTTVQAIGIDFIIHNLVPQQGLFLGEVAWLDFQGVLSTLRILPEHPVTFPVKLFELYTQVVPRAAFTLSQTPIGDFYADFGIAGVLVGMFLFGVISQILYIKTLRWGKDYFILPALVYLQYVVTLRYHIAGSIFGILARDGLALVIITGMLVAFIVILCLPLGRIIVKWPRRFSQLPAERKVNF